MNFKIVAVFCLLFALNLVTAYDSNDKVHYQLDDNVADENDQLDDNVADENDELDDNVKEENEELNENDEVSQTDIKPAESDVADEKSIQSDITDLAQRDAEALHKKKGFCHWGIKAWYKPGVQIRCKCMKCTCRPKGIWDCKYNFAYCPYYYCGNEIFNPDKQICCCGKVYNKRRSYQCCGYFYYNTRYSKCCKHDTVKPKKIACPRHKI
ncbi:putative mediator of RNA polymerase II transcription subunit 12 [Xenia sp. Carnegie-2017]|uniref:putative mediator of RNA polymerase II transcription subunit 12 n=1 Tax=Xenia sp. Carnegie-2017 TaxID=2897299 RepID=UPI001F040D5A|nr:putative mediator of RNA polymerase II transcription subunit 12 [Xenia sp. Carnegie-2017]